MTTYEIIDKRQNNNQTTKIIIIFGNHHNEHKQKKKPMKINYPNPERLFRLFRFFFIKSKQEYRQTKNTVSIYSMNMWLYNNEQRQQ
mgnify:CR=1 FL=1